MSKKFDEEYLAALKDSTPDLWERIESNLDENLVRDIPKTKKKNYKNTITYIALPIAALALGLVLLPIAMGNMGANEAVEMAYDTTGEIESFGGEARTYDTENDIMKSDVAEETVEECADEIMEECVEGTTTNDIEVASEEIVGEVALEDQDGTSDMNTETFNTEVTKPQTNNYDGEVVLVRYEEDMLPDISLQELGYQYIYIAKVVDLAGIDAETEIIIYSTEELALNNEVISVRLVETEEGFLLVENR